MKKFFFVFSIILFYGSLFAFDDVISNNIKIKYKPNSILTANEQQSADKIDKPNIFDDVIYKVTNLEEEPNCYIITVYCSCTSFQAQWCDGGFHPPLFNYILQLCCQACDDFCES